MTAIRRSRGDEVRLIKEDIEIQIHSAHLSLLRGYYASARAELEGAKMMIDQLEEVKKT